jgi:secreted Zn-dependent insulinase-like peptidase
MRQKTKLFWASLSIVFLLTACVVSPQGFLSNSPLKSVNDSRDYRYIQLNNKLKVLLVSDNKAERAAAALDVNVGSRQDPKDYQGLAHFLEHMLFLGTKKYPEAGEYQSYINAHGGSHNAYTSFEHTNYFFDVEPQYFDPALDRFAQFFVAPLFTETYVEREKNAVHSEYTAKIKDEWRRGSDVFKSIINQQHPYAKLSVGNLETLAGDSVSEESGGLKKQLLTFYDKNYSANIMTLVVVSPDTLDDLEGMVREKFSSVKNNNIKIEAIKTPLFNPGSLPLMVNIKPEKSMRTLSIVFPVDDNLYLYNKKPLHFLGNILGHEGKGSLLSFLKKKGWSEGLSAGSGLRYEGGATFNISIHLTESGVEESTQIVKAVFSTIKTIRDAGDLKWLFEEQKILSEQQFRYKEKTSPSSYASRLASGLQYYPVRDVLSAPYLITDYDPKTLSHFLSSLTPDNSVITLTAPEVETDQTSYFYETDYSVKSVAPDELAQWKSIKATPEIQLPAPNPFIAKDLSLVKDPADNDSESPRLLVNKSGLMVWYKSVDKFKSPKGSLFFRFDSPVASDTAENKAQMRLLMALISDQLNELSYAATLAGLQYSLYPNSRGFSVKISGFTDQQELLLNKILSALNKPLLNSDRFISLKSEHIRSLENSNKKQPYQLIMGELPDLLYRDSWNDQQILTAYQTLSLEDLKSYHQQMLAAGHISLLVYGNYEESQALNFSQQVEDALLKEPLASQTIKVAKLTNKPFSRELESHYDDASLLLYFQAKDTQISRRAAMGVSAQIMRSGFYTSLRTEQQLGYIVSSGAFPVMDIAGLFFMVQSPVAGPKQLQEKIEQYLSGVVAQLEKVTEEDFNRHRDTLVSRLAQEPQSLSEQADRYWQELGQGYNQFDFRSQLISAMQALNYQQWLDFFAEDVAENSRRITVFTTGKFVQAGKINDEPIQNVESFKLNLDHYDFPQ